MFFLKSHMAMIFSHTIASGLWLLLIRGTPDHLEVRLCQEPELTTHHARCSDLND
jgi:hypothetical protein